MDTSPSDSSRPIPPENVVEGCLLDYYYVEVIHAGVQCLLAVSFTYLDYYYVEVIQAGVQCLLAVSFTNLDYYYVEVIQAGVQCLLAVSFTNLYLARLLLCRGDTCRCSVLVTENNQIYQV